MPAWESARRFQRLHRRARDKSTVVGSEGSIEAESIGDTIAIAHDHRATILDPSMNKVRSTRTGRDAWEIWSEHDLLIRSGSRGDRKASSGRNATIYPRSSRIRCPIIAATIQKVHNRPANVSILRTTQQCAILRHTVSRCLCSRAREYATRVEVCTHTASGACRNTRCTSFINESSSRRRCQIHEPLSSIGLRPTARKVKYTQSKSRWP